MESDNFSASQVPVKDRAELWKKLDRLLPQTEPDITEEEILEEIKAHRSEK